MNYLPSIEESYFCKTLSCSKFDADFESIIKTPERAHRQYVKRCTNSYWFILNSKTNIILLPKVFLVNYLPSIGEQPYFCKTLSSSKFDTDFESIIKAPEREMHGNTRSASYSCCIWVWNIYHWSLMGFYGSSKGNWSDFWRWHNILHIDFSKDELFELHVAQQFWKFLFDQNVNRKVSPISRLGVQNAILSVSYYY